MGVQYCTAEVKALLPPEGKSHALRRRDGKRLPLHGTAPAVGMLKIQKVR